MTSTTRGAPTPALYWRRRLFVLGVVLALVLITVNLVSGPSDPDPGVRATTTAGDQADPADPEQTTGPRLATEGAQGRRGKKKNKQNFGQATGPTVALPTAPVLAEPEGECAQDDIATIPTVQDAVAGQSATIVLKLRTLTSEACTWQVSAESLAVRISVSDDEVWASRECPAQVPVQSVVVRRAVTSTYELRWNTRRSETECPALTEYAEPGNYRVTAGALGGEPAFLIFDLPAPTAVVPSPEPDPKDKNRKGLGKKKQTANQADTKPAEQEQERRKQQRAKENSGG